MAFFQWSEAMSVGVAVLDSDHRALIDLINALHDGLEFGDEPTELAVVFEQLVIYVDHHFAREEGVMDACGYPASAAHREEHRRLAQDMHYIRDRYIKGGEPRIGRELLDFLKDWLNHHILIQDMHYKTYLAGNQRAGEAAERFGPGLSDPAWKTRSRPPGPAQER